MTLKAFNNQQLKSISNLLLSRQIRFILRSRCLISSYPIATAYSSICKLVFEHKISSTLTKKYFTTNVRHTKFSTNTNFEDNNIESSEVDQELSKTCLYDDNDEMFRELNCSQSSNELLHNMNALESSMELKHYVQCILLLWNFNRNKNYKETSHALEETIIEKSLNFIEQSLKLMSSDELSCSYLYLRKMNVPNSNSVMQKLLIQALYKIESSTSTIPLSALSRLVVGINTGRDFFTPLVCRNFIPHVIEHINTLNSDEDARLLSICIFHLHPLVDTDILSSFKNRIEALLDKGVINAGTPKCILKILNTLNFYVWSQQNSQLIRKLMFTLGESLPLLDENELKVLCRIFQFHYEPATLGSKIKTAIQSITPISTPETLACVASVADPLQREPLIVQFKNLLLAKECWDRVNASGFFFLTLRTLKISDVKLCDAYWKGVIRELDLRTEEETHLSFLRHCNRYMNFNNNLGGTYRYLPLERKLSAMAMNAIENDIAGRIPSKFSRLAAFVLAYGHTSQSGKKFPNVVLSKIITMSEQFSIIDCFFISRGLQIAQELRFRHHIPTLLGMQLSTIDNILTTCAERHLRNDGNLTPTELNAIVRTLSNRKSLKSSVVFQETLKRFKTFNHTDLNSRSIRDMAYNFISSNFIVPETLEAMFKYIEVNNEHVMGETVERILTCAYHLGYTPESNAAFEYSAQIIIRDFSNMSGLSILQACLALCFYKTIPEILINKVFCVKFIQRIEDEIQMCYSKATYPERVLNVVMQLNRTVCLDFPESNVPWFQQNYIEAQVSKKPVMQNEFSENIKQFLTKLLKDEKYFRCNHTTPYGYQIDFVIHFDGNKSPIVAPVETTMLDRITKVAILLLKLDSFCENDLTSLRGPESLKMKHLEMMGYKVIHITEHDWNSKYLNAPEAKTNYLKCLLQIQN